MNWWNPSKKERKMVNDVGNELVAVMKSELQKRNLDVLMVKLVGSTALDTFVKGDFDFDVFVVAPTERDCNSVRKMFHSIHPNGHEKGGALKAWETKYRSPRHPDVTFDVDEICITPDHDRFATIKHAEIYGKLDSEQRQEIRKMKALLKSHGIYGAERGGFSSIAISESIRHFGSIENFCKYFDEHDAFPSLKDPAQEDRDVFGSIKAQNPAWVRKVKQKLRKACDEGILDHPYGKKDFLRDNKGNKIVSVKCPSADKIENFSRSMHACTSSINAISHGLIADSWCDVFIDKETCLIAFGFDVKDRKLGPPATMERAASAFKAKNPNARLDPADDRWYAPLDVDKDELEKKVMSRIVMKMNG